MRLARRGALVATAALSLALICSPAQAAPYFFSTGTPDGKLAVASRPAAEIEAADDFVVSDATALTGGAFTGLIPAAATLSSIQEVRVEIYRVFPSDSDVTRTSGPPTFSTAQVPTRVNSPSDVEAHLRGSTDGTLSFVASIQSPSFTTLNAILNGIHPKPNQLTGGDGPVTGQEVTFNVTFNTPIALDTGHYFLVPQVRLASGDFFWLSSPRPIVSPGTPFPAGSTDIQSWVRNAGLQPDWLRVGADIVGGGVPPALNGAFSLSGSTCSPIAVTPAAVPGGAVGAGYSTSFQATGGTSPYRFAASGALPAGLKLDPGGSLSGIPGQPGAFPLDIQATDANGCTGTMHVTLDVGPPAAAPGGPPATPGPPPGQAAPPSITAARLSRTTFRAAGRGASIALRRTVPVGATVTYRDSRAATTTFSVLRPQAGHRSGSRCIAGRPRRRQKPCIRYVALGSATHTDGAGSVSVRLSGRLRGHRLKPGRYRLTLTPRAGGETGKTVTLAFHIVA